MTAEATRFGFSNQIGGTVSSPNRYGPSDQPLEITWDPVKRWQRGTSPRTRLYYVGYFKRFLAASKETYGFDTPLGFLQWANSQRQWVTVEECLQEFTDGLKESVKGLAASAIRTFLQKNGYSALPKMGIPTYRGEYIEGYTREELIRLLSFLDRPFEKLFVLFQKDDGFRARTNLALRWHHLKRDFDAGEQFIHPYLEPKFYKGRKTAGLSFIGPDCIVPLKQLISQGKVHVNPERCDTSNADESKWRCGCKPIFPFAYATIKAIINRAKEKAGLTKRIQPTHGIRKFFEAALDRSEPRLDLDKKRQLEGHSLGVRWHYTPQIETLRPLYARVYSQLSLSEDVVADRKMRDLLEEVRQLRQENQALKDFEARLEKVEVMSGMRIMYVPDLDPPGTSPPRTLGGTGNGSSTRTSSTSTHRYYR